MTMSEEEKLEANLNFVYELMIREKIAQEEKEVTIKLLLRKVLLTKSLAEVIHAFIYPYFPAPYFEDTTTRISIPSGKLAFVGLSWDWVNEVIESENLHINFAIDRSALCRLIAENHNVGLTMADNDGIAYLIMDKNNQRVSIVDFAGETPEDHKTNFEQVLGYLSCERFSCVMDYEQYLTFVEKGIIPVDSKVTTHKVAPGVYKHVAMGLKDDKDSYIGKENDARYDLSSFEWVAPI